MAPRHAQAEAEAQAQANGAGGYGGGLDLEGELPEVVGRGRVADPIPADLDRDLTAMTEANKGVIRKTGSQAEITKFKNQVKRWLDKHSDMTPPTFRNAGVNPDGSESKLSQGSKDKPGTAVATIVCQVRKVEAVAK